VTAGAPAKDYGDFNALDALVRQADAEAFGVVLRARRLINETTASVSETL